MTKIESKDLQIEYPPPDNTKGEHMRATCDVTHVPTGMRARGRGPTPEVAKFAAMARLQLDLGYDIRVPAEQKSFVVPSKSGDANSPDGVEVGHAAGARLEKKP